MALSSLFEVGGKRHVIIATSALGMGVNIPDVWHIIHFGWPFDLEEFAKKKVVVEEMVRGKMLHLTISHSTFLIVMNI